MLGESMGRRFRRFQDAVRVSFENVRADVEEVKRSVTDWILYLDSNNRELQLRVADLEKEVRKLKREKEFIEVYN